MEQLNEDAHRDASRADLISFCTRYYTERHFPKTPANATETPRHLRLIVHRRMGLVAATDTAAGSGRTPRNGLDRHVAGVGAQPAATSCAYGSISKSRR